MPNVAPSKRKTSKFKPIRFRPDIYRTEINFDRTEILKSQDGNSPSYPPFSQALLVRVAVGSQNGLDPNSVACDLVYEQSDTVLRESDTVFGSL